MLAPIQSVLPRLALGRAALKTVTFRIIVTTLDFTVNYLVIGDFATAAGLSTFSLVAGPFFYFLHETSWSYFGPELRADGEKAETMRFAGVTMSRALGKTITFRVMATTAEFTTNFVVVGDLATAALLSSFGFVLGPFIYYAHERIWERFDAPPAEGTAPLGETPKLLTYAHG